MKTRILRKLNGNVKIVKIGERYQVQRKFPDGWHKELITNSIAKALHRKHNTMYILLGHLDYRARLFERRNKRARLRKRKEEKSLSNKEKVLDNRIS